MRLCRARQVLAGMSMASLLWGSLEMPLHAAQESLTILHTSEHHGTALPIERPGEPRQAGMAARATLINAVRAEVGDVLLVDSGDILIGTALSSFFRGEPDIKAMSAMGYDAMAAGNHDFDFGLDHLARLTSFAKFPILCSNLRASRLTLPCRQWSVVRIGRITVGLISLLGHRNFPDSFNRDVVKVLSLEDPVSSARALARALVEQEGADLVVAVTHQETPEDLHLLASVPEIHVIIGGHTEGFDGLRSATRTDQAAMVFDPERVFVKTHRQGRTVGRLDLVLETGPDKHTRILSAKARNLPVTEVLAADPEVSALIAQYHRKLETAARTVVGRSLVTLDGENSRVRSRETNLGSLLADLLRTRFETDVALVNGGQIRDSIPPGPVDVKRVLSVLPFNSPTVTFTLLGKHLLQALENSVSRLPGFDGRFLQVSGLSVTYNLSAPPGQRVRHVTVGGAPLNPSEAYTVATDSFLARGGDGYTMFQYARNLVNRQIPMRDLLLAALEKQPLKASARGRIQFVEKTRTERRGAHGR